MNLPANGELRITKSLFMQHHTVGYKCLFTMVMDKYVKIKNVGADINLPLSSSGRKNTSSKVREVFQ